MWPSLDRAAQIGNWANVCFIASLIVGVLSTVLIVWMANVKEAHWDEARQNSQERITQLQGDIADASVKIALANKEAETERLIRVKIEQQITPRRLPITFWTQQIGEKLLISLSGKVVRVDSYQQDLEAAALGMQVIDILQTAHINVRNAILTSPTNGSIDVGVHVTGDDDNVTNTILSFFSEAQIDAINHPPPNPTLRQVDTPPFPIATIFIGIKPLPR